MKRTEIEIDVYSRAMHIWNWLIAYYPDCPSIFPPPVYKTYLPRNENKDKTSFTVAEITTSWYEDDHLLELRDYMMKIYPDVYLDYLKAIFGDHPSTTAVLMIFDHMVIHEYFHYIRNYKAWLPSHEDNNIPYEVCKKDLKKYIRKMGTNKDEYETESLALKYLGEMYGINTTLNPVFTGAYARFMNKRDPTYKDKICVWNMLQMEFQVEHCDDPELREKLIKRWMTCVLAQTDSGRKVPIKVKCI